MLHIFRKIERLQLEIESKSQIILQLESEKSLLKSQNKDLQIQLDFKRAQTKYYQSSISNTLKSEPNEPLPSEKFRIKNGPSSDLNRIFEKYSMKRREDEGGRETEGNMSWRTPKETKAFGKIFDVQKTKATRPFLNEK